MCGMYRRHRRGHVEFPVLNKRHVRLPFLAARWAVDSSKRPLMGAQHTDERLSGCIALWTQYAYYRVASARRASDEVPVRKDAAPSPGEVLCMRLEEEPREVALRKHFCLVPMCVTTQFR